jgi:hypothetical protein
MSMKNSNDNTGNRNRDLPACSAVPKPTAPPLAPHFRKDTVGNSHRRGVNAEIVLKEIGYEVKDRINRFEII